MNRVTASRNNAFCSVQNNKMVNTLVYKKLKSGRRKPGSLVNKRQKGTLITEKEVLIVEKECFKTAGARVSNAVHGANRKCEAHIRLMDPTIYTRGCRFTRSQ